MMPFLLAIFGGCFAFLAILGARAFAKGGFPRNQAFTLTRRECIFDILLGTAGAATLFIAAWRW